MTPCDIVRCIDARYSEGRLVEGRMYVVARWFAVGEEDPVTHVITAKVPGVLIHGVSANGVRGTPGRLWRSSRFIPVNRKDLETEILAKVADKMMGGAK